MKFILASGNLHKKKEYETLLFPNTVDIVEHFDADETGSTYKENARIKLDTLINMLKESGDFDKLSTDTVLFADDSGMEIESHKEILGLYTSRFMSDTNATQNQKNEAVVELMKNENNRNARFVCHIAFMRVSDKVVMDATGEIKGAVAKDVDGNGGFGYDPIFIPNGETKTLATLGETYKNKHSHRANACSCMLKELKRI